MGPLKHPLQTARDQALDAGMKVCACGALMTPRLTRCRRCTCRLAQARYKRTEKGMAALKRYGHGPAYRAAMVRYRQTEKGRAARRAIMARYRQTEKGKLALERHKNSEKYKTSGARKIWLGGVCRGRAQTVEQAAMIRNHIKERTLEFIARQSSRAEAEGAAAGAVSAEAEP